MHLLKVPRVTLFYMHHHPKNVLPPVASRYIVMMPEHPVVPKLQHVYQNREKGTLWWSVSPAKMVSHKKVIRSYCSRRIRHAFHDALKQRGFDKDGKAFVLNEKGEVVGREKGLQGTLDIRMNAEMFDAKYADIQEQAGFLVDHLHKMMTDKARKTKHKTGSRKENKRKGQEEQQQPESHKDSTPRVPRGSHSHYAAMHGLLRSILQH